MFCMESISLEAKKSAPRKMRKVGILELYLGGGGPLSQKLCDSNTTKSCKIIWISKLWPINGKELRRGEVGLVLRIPAKATEM